MTNDWNWKTEPSRAAYEAEHGTNRARRDGVYASEKDLPNGSTRKRAARAPAPPSLPPPPQAAVLDEPPPATTPKPKRAAKPKKTAPPPTEPAIDEAQTVTLAYLSERYLAHLDVTVKIGTRQSYGIEMATALEELGPDTKLATLTPERVAAYFASDRVTKTKGGAEKAPPTVAKTQRVLRLALTWAQDVGIVKVAPIPQ